MRLEQHITNLCRSAYHQLHKIYHVRKSLTHNATKTLVHAFVTSHIDYRYCNSLLFGTPKHLLDHLQRVLNMAARLVTGSPRSSHITPVLQELHWLLVSHRIQLKIAQLIFKAFYGLAPLYVTDLLTPYTPTRSLRSAGKNLLVVPSYHLKSFVCCAINMEWSTWWNPQHF